MSQQPEGIHAERPRTFAREPCSERWVYPCTEEDLRIVLRAVDQNHLAGLWAVGLVPATERDWNANGRYFSGERPTIHLYAYPAGLSFRLKASGQSLETLFFEELRYGMSIQYHGGRAVARWELADVRTFTLCHVLMHEIGHHVSCWNRRTAGLPYLGRSRHGEQFAESYARKVAPRVRAAINLGQPQTSDNSN